MHHNSMSLHSILIWGDIYKNERLIPKQTGESPFNSSQEPLISYFRAPQQVRSPHRCETPKEWTARRGLPRHINYFRKKMKRVRRKENRMPENRGRNLEERRMRGIRGRGITRGRTIGKGE